MIPMPDPTATEALIAKLNAAAVSPESFNIEALMRMAATALAASEQARREAEREPSDAEEPPWPGWFSCENCNGWFQRSPVGAETIMPVCYNDGSELCLSCSQLAAAESALAERDAMLLWCVEHGADLRDQRLFWWPNRLLHDIHERFLNHDGTPAGRAEALRAALRKAMTS